MKPPSKDIIKDIVAEIDCESTCFYHPETEGFIAIPNFVLNSEEEAMKAAFKPELDKIAEDEKELVKIEGLSDSDTYGLMEEFIGTFEKGDFKNDLLKSLEDKHPLEAFNQAIRSSEFRQSWFNFKQGALEKKVKNILRGRK